MTMTLAVEAIVALLLIITICFCVSLTRRLKKLKSDEEFLRAVVADLMQATGKAENAIRTLKATAEECEHSIAERLKSADATMATLRNDLADADLVVSRLSQIAKVARDTGLKQPEEPAFRPVAATASTPRAVDGHAEETPVLGERAKSALRALRARAA